MKGNVYNLQFIICVGFKYWLFLLFFTYFPLIIITKSSQLVYSKHCF